MTPPISLEARRSGFAQSRKFSRATKADTRFSFAKPD